MGKMLPQFISSCPRLLEVCLKKKQMSLNQRENEKYVLIKGDNNYSNAKDNNEYFVLG